MSWWVIVQRVSKEDPWDPILVDRDKDFVRFQATWPARRMDLEQRIIEIPEPEIKDED